MANGPRVWTWVQRAVCCVALALAGPLPLLASNSAPSDAVNAEPLRVAVAEFADVSGARIDNLGGAFADKLLAELARNGVPVVARDALEARMRETGLDPTSIADLSRAAGELGARLVISGTVDDIEVTAHEVSILVVTVRQSKARVEASARLTDSSANETVSQVTAVGSGTEEGTLSVNLGSLLFGIPAHDVCGGGLRVERATVAEGEFVSVGFVADTASQWLGLEVAAADGAFLRWLGWRFVARGDCGTWFWNQRDALGVSVGPGVYTLRLRSGDRALAETSVEIRPSVSLVFPSLDLVTAGTTAFDVGSVGQAVDDAVSQLVASLLPALHAVGETARLAPRADPGGASFAQVAEVLPDGRVTLNVGAANGVAVGDRYEVLAVTRLVFDPETLAVLSYDVQAVRCEIEIVEVRDRASTAIQHAPSAASEPVVGDLARRMP